MQINTVLINVYKGCTPDVRSLTNAINESYKFGLNAKNHYVREIGFFWLNGVIQSMKFTLI